MAELKPMDFATRRKGKAMSDDLIRRQAAINTVLNIRKKCDTNDIDEYRDILVECFEELPTAEPRKGKVGIQ